MKFVPYRAAKVALVLATAFTFLHSQAETRSGHGQVHAVHGDVTYSYPGGVWQVLHSNDRLERGMVIKTGVEATADLILGYNGTILRLTPNSVLKLSQLDQQVAGDNVITETRLELLSGALAGSQRKLAAPSHLEIVTPQTLAHIVGTE